MHNAFLGVVEEQGLTVERFYAYGPEIHPCTACGGCREKPECIFPDEMEPLYEQIVNASGITISSPVFFSSLTAPLKCIIDRCQVLWEMAQRGEEIQKKTGFLILAGGGEYGTMFDSSLIIVKHFFKILNCSFGDDNYIGIDKTDELVSLSHHELEKARKRGLAFAAGVRKLKGEQCP